jgi:hypothetical protein
MIATRVGKSGLAPDFLAAFSEPKAHTAGRTEPFVEVGTGGSAPSKERGGSWQNPPRPVQLALGGRLLLGRVLHRFAGLLDGLAGRINGTSSGILCGVASGGGGIGCSSASGGRGGVSGLASLFGSLTRSSGGIGSGFCSRGLLLGAASQGKGSQCGNEGKLRIHSAFSDK